MAERELRNGEAGLPATMPSAGDGTRPHMCSDPHVLFCCVSTLFIIPMMYACDVPSVREALGRQHLAEVLEGRELEQNFVLSIARIGQG